MQPSLVNVLTISQGRVTSFYGAELQKYNIRVNSVSPGRTLTALPPARLRAPASEQEP